MSPLKRVGRTPTLWIVGGTLVFLLVLSFLGRSPSGTEMKFSDLQTQLTAGNVKTARILQGDRVVTGELNDGTTYRTTYVADYVDELQAQLNR